MSQSEPVVELPHTGTIITDQPDMMWGTGTTAAVTVIDGQVMVFAAIDPCTAECVGIQAAIHGDRFEDLEPLRQGVRKHFGAIAPAVAAGLAVRHDHGSVYLSADFRKELAFLGMTPSPAFVRQPEGTGCIERFFRTLKERLLWVRPFGNVEELRQGLLAFKETCNQEWLVERLGFRAGAGTSGICGQVRGLITLNPLSITRGPVQPIQFCRSRLPALESPDGVKYLNT